MINEIGLIFALSVISFRLKGKKLKMRLKAYFFARRWETHKGYLRRQELQQMTSVGVFSTSVGKCMIPNLSC